ncbi:RNase H1/viroplasmin domain-containing protein (plasmid) [Clostridium perfringens]
MSKKKPKKFYAIKVGKGVENIIVKSWDECSKLVLGFNATYKSFYTEDEAKAYLNQSVEDIEKTKVNTSKRKKGEVFIDFSLKKDTFEKFEAKCLEFGIKKEKILKLLVEEWLED